MLYEQKLIFDDQLSALERNSKKFGTTGDDIDYALLVDGLEAEREQGITIDVAYRYFATARRSFIVADTPGHEQYTRNMATGASNADLAIVLVDARKGLLTQTHRHSIIVSLLGVRHVVLRSHCRRRFTSSCSPIAEEFISAVSMRLVIRSFRPRRPRNVCIRSASSARRRCFLLNHRVFEGFDLLRQFFMFPRKFLGCNLTGLDEILPKLKAKTVDILYAFDEVNTRLAAAVQPSTFAVHAAPAISQPFREDRRPDSAQISSARISRRAGSQPLP